MIGGRWLKKLLEETRPPNETVSWVWDPHRNHRSSESAQGFVSVDDLKQRIHCDVMPSLLFPSGAPVAPMDIDGVEVGVGRFSQISALVSHQSWRVENLAASAITIEGSNISVENVRCKSLILNKIRSKVDVVNCDIGELIVSFSESDVNGTLSLISCRIGSVDFSNEPKLKDIHIKRTAFFRGAYPADILDLFKLGDPYAPRSNRATFSRLLKFAKSVGNADLANLARTEELARDRVDARGLDWLVLSVWGCLSRYGSSVVLPIFWLLVAIFTSFSIMLSEGTVLSQDSGSLVGWRQVLSDQHSEVFAPIARAMVGAVEGVLSPLSSLGVRALVVPQSVFGLVAKMALGYFSIVCLFLFGFAMRRRFRSYE